MCRLIHAGFVGAVLSLMTARAQEPVLLASEVAAYDALCDWQSRSVDPAFGGIAQPPLGYSVHEFGYDAAGALADRTLDWRRL